jgi:putative flavoprotein involved in K+ transport
MDGNAGTIIIGAGQAGLAMSRCLRDHGLPHLVLERGRVGQRWRSERWDSFTLLSPNWQTRLPGHRYAGPDPDGFMPAAAVADMLEDYGRGAPVRTGVTVDAVHPSAFGWWVLTSVGSYLATDVVVATGDLDRPAVPALAGDLPPRIHQLHTSDYRSPAQLPAGGVLVVGAGPSGQQIADELARAGRAVHIAVGRHKSLPRRYRGRDAYWWMDRMGMLHRTVESLPQHRAGLRTPNAVLTGGTDDLDLHRLVRHGVVPHGHLTDVRGGVLSFAADLAGLVDAAERNAVRFRATVDDHVLRTRVDVPVEPVPAARPAPWADDPARTLDLDRTGIGTVVWATGFRRDFSWLHAPVLDDFGEPVQHRGVTAADGLYFLGLRWMHRRSSSFLDGVGRDAEHLAECIAERTRLLAGAAA